MTVTPSSTPSMETSSFISRAKATGKCSPSLLPVDSELAIDDSFIASISRLVEENSGLGLSLRSDVSIVADFQKLVELSTSDDASVTGNILLQRRSILLLVIGCTPQNNDALKSILQSGFLKQVKSWLEDVLADRVGGVDLLLHLLSSISMLPVSKEMVTSSKLGKQVAAVEKHKICVGGMNESTIRDRVAKVKDEWSASVKRMKKMKTGDQPQMSKTSKRSLDENENGNIASKRSKSNDIPKKTFLLSDLLKQDSQNLTNQSTAVEHDSNETIKNHTDPEKRNVPIKESISPSTESDPVMTNLINDDKPDQRKKNKNLRIKWADDEGGILSISHDVENIVASETKERSLSGNGKGKDSWSDRKKRDRLKERELIEKARKNKLPDKDDNLDTMAMIFSSKWHQPKPLPPDAENSPAQIDSLELAAQRRRIASVLPVNFLSEDDVPSNPYPLTETEQTMDFNAQSASVPQSIPFFITQSVPTPTPAPAPLQPNLISTLPVPIPPGVPPPPLMTNSTIATLDIVRLMGLPDFLAGQNLQALQAIKASPGLLNTFVDVNGNYDQLKILTLVQAMAQNLLNSNIVMPPPIPSVPVIPPPIPVAFGQPYGRVQPVQQYQSLPQAASYKPPTKPTTGYRGDQNNTDGNLHLSGYGPSTTPESLVAMFSPYVKVDEVVPKNGFMFLNTNDPEGAKRAKEALNGVMVGGSPLRINMALRKAKKTVLSASSTRTSNISSAPLPRNALGQIDFDTVRDDRGNPATKNLFVAGYGQGTTEQQLKDVFSQHTHVSGIVMKGSFAFVNTLERSSAVVARQSLLGTGLNGGSLRINFAKESGRLGTSFDGGYGPSNSNRTPVAQSYYGRSY